MVGCANRPVASGYIHPMDKVFIPDEIQLDPPDSLDLQKLVLTLPLFEVTVGEIEQYVSRNTSVTHTQNEWSLNGDGAQDDLKVIRLQPSEEGYTQIKVIRFPGSAVQTEYFLKRVGCGWRHLSNKNVEQVMDVNRP